MSKEIHQEIVQMINLCSNFKSKSKFTIAEKKAILIQIEAGLGKFEIVRYITNFSQKDDDYDEMDSDEIGPNLSWNDLYKDFVYFINLEMHAFRKAMEKKTKTMPKIESFNCLKLILSHGCGENCLNVNDVCKFLVDNLDDDSIASVHFADLNKIIDGAILKNSRAFCELSQENFIRLLNIYVEILKTSPEIGSDSCLSTLKNLLQVGIYQFDLDFIQLLNEFCSIILKTDKKKSNLYWSNLIICSNTLMKFYGFNNRKAFSSFGERVADKILPFFNQTNLEQNVIKFFHYQMIFHHPDNVSQIYDGAFVDEEWKNVVKSLYFCLSTYVESNCLKFASLSTFAIKRVDSSKMNELLARVMIQVFNWGEEINVVPSTQFNSSFIPNRKRLNDGSVVASSQRKRICLDLGWAPFVQNLEEKLNTSNINPWLLVLETVLYKFFRCVDNEDVILIAKFVLKLITVSKRPDVLRTGVELAQVLVEKVAKLIDNSVFVDVLKQFYSHSIRLSLVKNVQNEVFDLLSAIVSLNLIESTRVQKDLCMVFATSAPFPTTHSSNFLFNYFRRCEFNEKFCDIALLESDSLNDDYKFRSFLIQWMLFKRNLFDDVSSNAGYKVLLLLPPHILARNLQQICYKRPFEMKSVDDKETNDDLEYTEKFHFLSTSSWKVIVDQAESENFTIRPEIVTDITDVVVSYVEQMFEDILAESDSVDIKIINSALSFGYFVCVWFKSFQNFSDLKHFEQNFDEMCKVFVRRCVSFEAQYDLVEKFIPLLRMLEINEIRLTRENSLFDVLTLLSRSLQSRVKNVNEENYENNEATEETNGVLFPKFVQKTFELLVFTSSYRFDCGLKLVAERVALDALQRLNDDEDEFSLKQNEIVDVVCVICKTGFETFCTVKFAKLALSLVKNALDRGYKNHVYCQKLLDCCSHLPNNVCFNDDDVRVQFFRIVAGFKRIGNQIKYTSSVKTSLVRCLINIEKRHSGNKISFNENNNEVEIYITNLVLEFVNGGSSEFDEICKNVALFAKSRLDANACLDLLFTNAVKDDAPPLKIYSVIHASVKLMKHSSNFISVCLFTLCKICRHSPDYWKIGLEILEKNFSTELIEEILKVNLNFCILQWGKIFDGDWKLFPYQLWRSNTFDDFLAKNVAHFISNSANVQFDQVALDCFPDVFVNYYAMNDVSTSISMKKFANFDLEKQIRDHFGAVIYSLTQRIFFEKDVLAGEINVKTWENVVRFILKTIRSESLTQAFVSLSKKNIDLLDVFLTFRSSVCSKLYSLVNFKRYFYFVSSLNYANFTSLSSIIVRETLLTMKYLLRNAVVDEETLQFCFRLCKKIHSETPVAFVKFASLILLPAFDYTTQSGSTTMCEIIRFLFRCLSETQTNFVCNAPLLPKIESLADLREIQLHQRLTVPLSEDIDRVLATPNDSVRYDDLEYVCSKLNLQIENVSSMNKMKMIALMNKCLSLCVEKFLAPIAAKIIDISSRGGFTLNAVSVDYFFCCKPIFHQILEKLDEEFQSEIPIRAQSSWKCLKQLLPQEDFSVDVKCDSNSCLAEFVSNYKSSSVASHCKVASVTGEIYLDEKFFCFDHEFSSFDDWILKFLPKFIFDQANFLKIFAPLRDICKISVHFCEDSFPCVVEYFLLKVSIRNQQVFSQNCNKLFASILKNQEQFNKNDLRKFARLFLNLIRRLQNSSEIEKTFEAYRLLEIDYCLFAELCLCSGFYYESLMFVEIGSEKLRTKQLNSAIYKDKSKKNFVLFLNVKSLTILRETYPKLNNVDAIYGLGEACMSNSFIRSFLWNAEYEWNKAVSFHSSLDSADSRLLQQATFALGLDDNFLKLNPNLQSADLQSYRCHCAVSLGLWDTVEVSKTTTTNFHQLVFDAISSSGVRKEYFLDVGRSLLKENISSSDFQSFIEKSCLLNEMRIYFDEFSSSPSTLLKKWIDDELNFVDNQVVDDNIVDIIRSFRWAILHKRLTDVKKDVFIDAVNCFANFTERRIDCYRSKNMASIAVKLAKQFQNRIDAFRQTIPVCSFYIGNLKEVEILFDSGEQFLAVSKLKSLIETLSSTPKTPTTDLLHLKAKCLILLGEYQTKFDSPESANECWNQAASMLETFPSQDSVVQTLCSAFASMAQYADENYQNLTDYIRSSSFASKKVYIEKFKPVAEMVKQGKQILSLAGRRSHLDNAEVAEIVETQQNLMQAAVSYYLRCLALTSEYDLKIFRVISLWFENLDSASLAQSFVEFASQIPTHKWLLVWTQLTSRLSSVKNDPFVATVNQIIQNTALDHPYHTFYALFALKTAVYNENDDQNKQLRRVAADKMISQLKKSHRAGIFKDLDLLAESYIEIGSIPTTTMQRSRKHPIPNGMKLLNYSYRVPVVTVDLKVEPSANYKNFISVVKFERYITIANGKSAPAVVYCVCSDGKTRKQLVKGHDDMRQDAIIEQVFGLVNVLLKKKKLQNSSDVVSRIRTYNVIPLSPLCGVIEWCDGAISFGDYLVGPDSKTGAHKRVYPDDWNGYQCRNTIGDVSKRKFDDNLKIFLNVCDNLQPVFRYFFFEKFQQPMLWYNVREKYVRSVAVSSMVGHVLGLSDRHAQNLLVDESSGELIQIDLGMAFEQGRILPTPERVPFRLTRDIVDGMGVCGTEGVFRRNCERVMRLLRDSKDVLVPIVSVLLHDPVSNWVLSSEKIKKVQSENVGNKNEHAERAILKVVDKLKGMEKATILTVEGQVAYLINQARDPANLCQMFVGWQAYL